MRIDPRQKIGKKKTKTAWGGFLIRLAMLFALVALSYAGFVGYKLCHLQSEIFVPAGTDRQQHSRAKGAVDTAISLLGSNRAELRGEKDGRINILLLGMGGEGHKGKYLTDTIMLASVDPRTYKSALLSIPRDLYAEIGSSKVFTKINAIYTYGKKNKNASENEALAGLKQTVENITGQKVHYYVMLDFEGFKQIIKEVGGVDVEVQNDIRDSRYPGPNYSYETFEISKGFHHLDAETALKYSRVRHTAGGDFGRAARQQQVIASAKRKAFSIGTIANPVKIGTIIDALGEHLKTDIQLSEIPSFIHLANNINIYETPTKVLDAWSADSLLGSTHVDLGGVPAYVLIPRARNYSQIRELAENILDLGIIERKREAIKKEQAKIAVVPQQSRNSYKIINIMDKLGYKAKIESPNVFPFCANDNSIFSLSRGHKLFTLDDLADKLGTGIAYAENVEADYDVVICLSDEAVEYFEKQDEQEEDDSDRVKESILDEQGNVLINN